VGVENDTEIDVSIIGGRETGFLARYFLRSEEVGKNPVSLILYRDGLAVKTATTLTKSAYAD
jgi:hypothetical protein